MELPRNHVTAAAPAPIKSCRVPEYHQVRVVTRETRAPAINNPNNETINEKTKLLKPNIYGARGIIAPMAKDTNDEIAANLAEVNH